MSDLLHARPGHVGRRAAFRLVGAAIGLAALSGARRAAAQAPAAAGGTPPRIGIIGSGHIGSTVGTLWVKAGHSVMFSSRHPEELKTLVGGLGPLARAGTVAEAIAFGDVVFVAVPYGALPGIGRDNAAALRGKIVLDACNAVAARDGDVAHTAMEKGIGLETAALLPGARVVRAFNTLGYRILAENAHRAGAPMAIPIAGDDPDAVRTAAALVRDAGFDPVEVGPLARASQFAQGGPGYGQQVTAPELRQRLGLTQ